MTDQNELNLLISEYEKSQDSAEHHDHLAWFVTSIFRGGSLVLIGTIFSALIQVKKLSLTWSIIVILFSILGMYTTFIIKKFHETYRKIVNRKYDRCKEISDHSKTRGIFTQHTECFLKYQKGTHKKNLEKMFIVIFISWCLIIILAVLKSVHIVIFFYK